MKTSTLIGRMCLLASMLLAFFAPKSQAQFAKGADVGWLSEMEDAGRVFYDDDGSQKDLMQILKNHGMDSIRLRVWVNPTGWYSGADDVVELAVRAKNMGMRVMIDFHYSDSWADPGQQTPPAEWSSYNLDWLMTAVYWHTHDVLSELKANGVTPEWVQVGNETNNGMLWPIGRASDNMQNFAWLINSGYDAVKAVDSSIKVIVHIANGDNNGLFRWIFDGLQSNGGKWDIIGMSLYPNQGDWASMNQQCLANMNDMVSRYGTPVMMCEVGMPQDNAAASKAFLADIISKTRSVSGGNGLGVLYWEPQAYSWNNYPFSAWDADGTPTEAMDAFLEGAGAPPTGIPDATYRLRNRATGRYLDNLGATNNGASVGQWSGSSSNNQKWVLTTTGSYRKLQCVTGSMYLDSMGRTSDGSEAGQWSNSPSYNQQWTLEHVTGNYYRIVCRANGKALDTGGQNSNGTFMQQWYVNGSENQQWEFVQ